MCYKCKPWGQYPALVNEQQDATVQGVAYEGEMYILEDCLIELQDGSQILGSTFKWRGDEALLKEGPFDLKDWQMKNFDMGRHL
jgi:hypothetical protein